MLRHLRDRRKKRKGKLTKREIEENKKLTETNESSKKETE